MKQQPTARHWLSPLRISLALLALALLAGWVYLQKQAPPRCARLLPESQAIVYLDLAPIRAATHFDRHPVPHDPAYQQFINATGIDLERDLREAAFALQRSDNPFGPNGPVAYSEVFTGRFDPARLTGYLAANAASQESYAEHTIYSVPSDGRTVRIVVLDSATVGISNTPTAEQIHAILDRARGWSSPFGGPTLLTAHYRDVPLLSLAWGVGEIGLPFAENGQLRLFGFTLPIPLDATLVASLRWSGALRMRVEEIAPGQTAAAASAGALRGLIEIGRLAENNLPDSLTDANALALLQSAVVTQTGNRAVLETTLPQHLLERLVESPKAVVPPQGKESR